MDLLKRFYNDIHTREAFKEFQTLVMKDLAVDRVFNKKDVTGIYEALELINSSFSKLEEMYGTLEKSDPVNEAR